MSMPKAMLVGQNCNFSVGHYITASEAEPTRDLFRFQLPDFQRPKVWVKRQQIQFIESLWLGFHPGFCVYVESKSNPALQCLLIDGQQRLTALRAYAHDQFEVFGERFSALNEVDLRRFKNNTPFPSIVIKEGNATPELLLEMYVRMNYSGVPHGPEHHPRLDQTT